MEEGAFYLVFNKEIKGISYAVMNGEEHHTGEIVEDKYKPLKDRLRRRGTLSLKEVNFLIELALDPLDSSDLESSADELEESILKYRHQIDSLR
jgi:hypothetical protein